MNKKKPIIIISAIALCIIVLIAIWPPHTDNIIVSADSVDATHTTNKPNIKVFLENSGSMNGYMVAGSQLKDALFDYVSDLSRHCNELELYYVNSAVIPRSNDLDSYIKNLTPSSFAASGGNHSNTDIGQIVKEVLGRTEDSDVSLLVSDFILDLPSKDASRFLNQKSIQIKNAVIDKIQENPDFAVIIVRLESVFTGKYFYPNGAVEQLDNVKRPYYIWIFGNKKYLATLKRNVPFSDIKHGYKNYVAYSSETNIPYIVTNMGMTSSTIKAKKGIYEIMIRADFTPTLQPESVISDKSSYKFSSQNTSIAQIAPITSGEENFTNFIVLSIDSKTVPQLECVKFMPPHMPHWVTTYNDESADSIMSNLDKTTGIKALIQGVADAYKNQLIATQFNINISKRK